MKMAWIIITGSIVSRLVFIGVVMFRFFIPPISDGQPFDKAYFSLLLMSLVSRIMCLLLFSYMALTWILLLRFFISKKEEKLESKLSNFNIFIVGVVVFLTVADIYNQYSVIICGTLELFGDLSEDFKFYFTFQLYIFDSLLNFMIALSLLYLFYY